LGASKKQHFLSFLFIYLSSINFIQVMYFNIK